MLLLNLLLNHLKTQWQKYNQPTKQTHIGGQPNNCNQLNAKRIESILLALSCLLSCLLDIQNLSILSSVNYTAFRDTQDYDEEDSGDDDDDEDDGGNGDD